MTTLAANLSDSAESMRVNAADADPAPYYQIDSEIIQVMANGTTIQEPSYGPRRSRDATLWPIERGISGTTRATHNSGATLTAVYDPSVGGAPGGGLTVTDGTVSVETTELSMPPGTVTDEGAGVAAYTGGFVASAVDPGAIGAGAVWKDISQGPGLNADWWERNGTNDGWDPLVLMTVEGSGATEAQAGISVATVNGDGLARLEALATGSGAAFAKPQALTQGAGTATAGSAASAEGSGDADAGSLSQTITGTAFNYVLADRNGTQAGLNVEVGAGGPVITLLGLPAADPEVAGALYTDGAPAPGVGAALMVSGGPA